MKFRRIAGMYCTDTAASIPGSLFLRQFFRRKWDNPLTPTKTKKTVVDGLHFVLVGVRRFELPASWSRTKRSTKLSHTPLFRNTYIIAKNNVFVKTFFGKI